MNRFEAAKQAADWSDLKTASHPGDASSCKGALSDSPASFTIYFTRYEQCLVWLPDPAGIHPPEPGPGVCQYEKIDADTSVTELTIRFQGDSNGVWDSAFRKDFDRRVLFRLPYQVNGVMEVIYGACQSVGIE
ncbi:MAG: hypothetical protein P4M08_11155 [Oligoflexia bacterium]|nr:hypothetical protein [Oligoflexia bacterium]